MLTHNHNPVQDTNSSELSQIEFQHPRTAEQIAEGIDSSTATTADLSGAEFVMPSAEHTMAVMTGGLIGAALAVYISLPLIRQLLKNIYGSSES